MTHSPKQPDGRRDQVPRGASVGEQGFRVEKIGKNLQGAAVARLLDLSPADPSVGKFVRDCSIDGTDLSLMWGAVDLSGRVGQVCMAVINPGRTVVLLPSPTGGWSSGGGVSAGVVRAQRAGVIAAGCEELGKRGDVRLAQALTEPEEQDLIDAFLDAGFTRLADLAYMRRPISRGSEGRIAFPEGVEVTTLSEFPPNEGELVLREALEQSYVETLDCPDLCGMRTLDDVIESHRAVGTYDPSMWYLVMEGRRAVGCLLLSGDAGPGTVELVYLGLAPPARGRGIASNLLRMGMTHLSGRSESTIACAVDLRNAPALELYRRAGFKKFATRVAMIRTLSA